MLPSVPLSLLLSLGTDIGQLGPTSRSDDAAVPHLAEPLAIGVHTTQDWAQAVLDPTLSPPFAGQDSPRPSRRMAAVSGLKRGPGPRPSAPRLVPSGRRASLQTRTLAPVCFASVHPSIPKFFLFFCNVTELSPSPSPSLHSTFALTPTVAMHVEAACTQTLQWVYEREPPTRFDSRWLLQAWSSRHHLLAYLEVRELAVVAGRVCLTTRTIRPAMSH